MAELDMFLALALILGERVVPKVVARAWSLECDGFSLLVAMKCEECKQPPESERLKVAFPRPGTCTQAWCIVPPWNTHQLFDLISSFLDAF